MIPAAKSPLVSRLFSRHAESRMRRHFAALRVDGLEACADLARERPVLFVANHSAWWDPMVAMVLSHRLMNLDGYALMDAANLRRRAYFVRVGAVGVDVGDRRSGARAIRHCASLLDRPGRALWVFPQGREVPHGQGPLRFEPGAAAVARIAPRVAVVPVGIRYVHGSHERPDLWVSLGPALPPRSGPDEQAAAVQKALDRIALALRVPQDRLSAAWHNRFDEHSDAPGLAERLLSLLTGAGRRVKPRTALPGDPGRAVTR